MRRTVVTVDTAIHGKSFALDQAKTANACKSPMDARAIEASADSVSLLLDVLDHFRVEPKQACDWMGMDRSKFTRIKTREAKPTLEEIDGLPSYIWLEWRRRVELERGINPEREDEIEEQQILQVMQTLLRRRRRVAAVGGAA